MDEIKRILLLEMMHYTCLLIVYSLSFSYFFKYIYNGIKKH
jgi:hypothetical protein